ncbi:MAG TPA: alpha/beta hydrolase-fold protein [Telluria sp.]|nr:alpha/beta hydrolase-fold protein [Telluria sp.]
MKPIRYALLALSLACASAHATTVRIHYDAGTQALAVRGDKGPMTWSQGVPAERGVDGVWSYTWPDALGDVQMKPALGDKVSTGGVYRIKAGGTLDIYPFFGAPFGKVTIVEGIESPQLKNKRALRVYLPPSYQENTRKHYPVLYMHDGQNLFDAKTASFGTEWGIDETVNRLIATGQMAEVIVVGIDNTPERIAEYTPCCDPKHGGGRLDAYRKFIVETVKPYVDRSYRTLPGREHTAIMGSSLGGIASVYIAQKDPGVFSKAGGVSSSFWWNQGALTKTVPRVPVKFYIDAGTRDDGLPDTERMRDAMLSTGYRPDVDLYFHAADGGSHNEKSWAARVDKPLVWFFPWNTTTP